MLLLSILKFSFFFSNQKIEQIEKTLLLSILKFSFFRIKKIEQIRENASPPVSIDFFFEPKNRTNGENVSFILKLILKLLFFFFEPKNRKFSKIRRAIPTSHHSCNDNNFFFLQRDSLHRRPIRERESESRSNSNGRGEGTRERD